MARAQFDRNEVVSKSKELFWHNGYNGSSMQQVVKATGLKPGSIYLAFGSKNGLYREAIEDYAFNSSNKMEKMIKSAPSVGVGICSVLEMIVHESAAEDYCSCFLIKTQLELSSEKDNELYALSIEKLGDNEKLFQKYLSKEFNEDLSHRRAVSLMLHIYGIRVYGYKNSSLESMRLGLREGLPWLPWDKTQS